MAPLLLTKEAIVKHFDGKKKGFEALTVFSPLTTDTLAVMADRIDGYLVRFPAKFTWHDVSEEPDANKQRMYWLFREFMFAQFLLYVVVAIETNAQTVVSLPADFSLEDHSLHMFGSNNATSDIDISVEGPYASYFIELCEKLWKEITHEDTTKFDIEFYGDFLELYDEKGEETYINSRDFSKARLQILPFAGASILRNTGTLDFPLLNDFIEQNSKLVPELKDPVWKVEAQKLIDEWKKQNIDQQRATYYRLLREAEEIRKHPASNDPYENHLRAFLLLSKANLYRSENYVLPSTVIFVVRDIQAMSPNPQPSMCGPYHVRLASCALGDFTYLTSAMEQIGFMKRFEGAESKQKKYGSRLERALSKVSMSGGRRRRARYTKKRRNARKRTTRARRAGRKSRNS